MFKPLWLDLCIGFLTLTIVVISVVVACKSGNWHWSSRSGAILILGGAVLEYRNADFLMDGKQSFKYTTQNGIAALREGSRANVILKWIAHAMVIGGTFVAGYGDFVG